MSADATTSSKHTSKGITRDLREGEIKHASPGAVDRTNEIIEIMDAEDAARTRSTDELADEMMEQLAPDSARALEGFIDAYLAAGFTREEASILAEIHHRQVMAGVRRKAVAFTATNWNMALTLDRAAAGRLPQTRRPSTIRRRGTSRSRVARRSSTRSRARSPGRSSDDPPGEHVARPAVVA